eukprot:gene19334-25198_t
MIKLPDLASIDVLTVIAKVDSVILTIRSIKSFDIDLTAGASMISSPNYNNIPITSTIDYVSNVSIITDDEVNIKPSPLLRIHQLGKRAAKRLPDNVLLGVLVLIATELLEREIYYKSPSVPLAFRELANVTMIELNSKLEMLSQMQWDLDPFIQNELENLQTQPLEAIDKFIVNEILPRVDKELSPILNKLTTDPTKIRIITKNIKDLIQLSAYLIIQPNKFSQTVSPLEHTTSTIMEQVDLVGQSIEAGVKEWNRIIEELSKIVKSESVIKLLPSAAFPRAIDTTLIKTAPNIEKNRNITVNQNGDDSNVKSSPIYSYLNEWYRESQGSWTYSKSKNNKNS